MNSDATFIIQWTGDFRSTQDPFTINVYDAPETGASMSSGSAFGKCDGGKFQPLPEETINHELVHHEPELNGRPLPGATPKEERRATEQGENVFLKAIGHRLRCRYP